MTAKIKKQGKSLKCGSCQAPSSELWHCTAYTHIFCMWMTKVKIKVHTAAKGRKIKRDRQTVRLGEVINFSVAFRTFTLFRSLSLSFSLSHTHAKEQLNTFIKDESNTEIAINQSRWYSLGALQRKEKGSAFVPSPTFRLPAYAFNFTKYKNNTFM